MSDKRLIECLWCGARWQGNSDYEHLLDCQAQLNWQDTEVEDGKVYLIHPDFPSMRFERIARVN